ncbi:MAG: mechanosensitive ion channel family protein [Muribaculaceae bacterium]|nr:mechanosensitive ion channel family protein [Muribaculaceae bacterium]
MLQEFSEYLQSNLTFGGAATCIVFIKLLTVAVSAVAGYFIIEGLLQIVRIIVGKTPTTWDDDMFTPRILRAVSQLAPAIIVNWMIPGFFADSSRSLHWLTAITALYIVWAGVRIFTIALDNLYEAFVKRPRLRPYAVKGIFQMLKLILIAIAIIIGLSILIGRSPTVIVTTLGASAAVLMLVFRDTILGLVASVQLTANKMVQRGDWIATDKHDANGEVIDVSLTTVKVRNWDNSVTTIPPYSLVSESFRNYQPMSESGGRRVDRSIYIDVNTVRFCTPAELADLAAEGWLEGLDIDAAAKVVNLHLLRRYLERYLATDERINSGMTHMVRQLQPTPTGLPLQLYFFTRTTVWTQFEAIQSDIFDHVYAIVRRFGLAIYQAPAGRDFISLQR